MNRPLITSRWYRQSQAAHEADLAKPQRFPLTGDGEHAEKITTPAVWTGRVVGSAQDLARARYRDWLRRQA